MLRNITIHYCFPNISSPKKACSCNLPPGRVTSFKCHNLVEILLLNTLQNFRVNPRKSPHNWGILHFLYFDHQYISMFISIFKNVFLIGGLITYWNLFCWGPSGMLGCWCGLCIDRVLCSFYTTSILGPELAISV